ncbi:helix-turn-helix transcriptional regulator [Arthrobacter flavus]|uniref:helix-turn-helix transcriptional regulator n=1 Tax=Arthrobacter flavus TaxID=95172 RepID=UPI003672CB8F
MKVLTRVEVARILGIAPKTLANWYSSGIGPPVVKLHGLVRYDEADFITWYQTMKTVA